MPLLPGHSRAARSTIVAAEVRAGKPRAHAHHHAPGESCGGPGACSCHSCKTEERSALAKQYAASTPVKPGKGGVLASRHSKTGNPKCSKAVSDWKLGKATSETHKTLAACRAEAAALTSAKAHRAFGNDLKADRLEHQVKTGAVGKSARHAKARELNAGRLATHLEQGGKLEATHVKTGEKAHAVLRDGKLHLVNPTTGKTLTQAPIASGQHLRDVLKATPMRLVKDKAQAGGLASRLEVGGGTPVAATEAEKPALRLNGGKPDYAAQFKRSMARQGKREIERRKGQVQAEKQANSPEALKAKADAERAAARAERQAQAARAAPKPSPEPPYDFAAASRRDHAATLAVAATHRAKAKDESLKPNVRKFHRESAQAAESMARNFQDRHPEVFAPQPYMPPPRTADQTAAPAPPPDPRAARIARLGSGLSPQGVANVRARRAQVLREGRAAGQAAAQAVPPKKEPRIAPGRGTEARESQARMQRGIHRGDVAAAESAGQSAGALRRGRKGDFQRHLASSGRPGPSANEIHARQDATARQGIAQRALQEHEKAERSHDEARNDLRSPEARVKKMGRGWFAEHLGGATAPTPFKSKQEALAHLQTSDPFIRETRGSRAKEARERAIEAHKTAGLPLPASLASKQSPAEARAARLDRLGPSAPHKVGEIVKFRLPHATQGSMSAAGTVKRILPDGRLEVRLQQGGYHTLAPSEVVKPSAAPPARVKPPAAERAAVLANRAGGLARQREAQGNIAGRDVNLGRKARLQALANPPKEEKPFGLKPGGRPASLFGNAGKGATPAMFDEMKGAAARDLPGQTSFTDYPTKRERADLHTQAPPSKEMAGVLNRARAAQQGRSKAAARIKQLRAQPVRSVPTNALHFDPQRFQYKLGASAETGSVDSLKGVHKWDPARAGVIQVWKDPADGKTYVVNGHNRLAKAKQLGVKSINTMHLDARDANEAKNIGALTNIAEGRGTSMDAAKFMRGMGIHSKEDFARHDLPLRESVATEGLALAGLPEHHFNRVVQGELPAHHAAIIGGSGLPHSRQAELFKLYDQMKGNVGGSKIHAWVNNAHAASATKGKEQSLFGDDAEEQSDFLHRSNLDEHVMRRLGEEKSAFGAVSKQKRADLLAKGGNTIDTAASGQLADQARENHAIYKGLNNTSVFSRLKGEHAKRLAEAKGPKQRGQVMNDYYEAVQHAAKDAYQL